MLRYIAFKRFHRKGIDGFEHNLHYGDTVAEENGMLFSAGHPICVERSLAGHTHFAWNDDGRGLERGTLTASIIKALANPDKRHRARWDMVWDDARCQPYRRTDQPEDVWLWSEDFYRLDIDNLEYIAALVGAKKGA